MSLLVPLLLKVSTLNPELFFLLTVYICFESISNVSELSLYFYLVIEEAKAD